MPPSSGTGKNGKIIKVRPYEDEGDDKLLWLTDRMRGILLGMTEYLEWKTRWETFPAPLDNDNDRDTYVSNLKDRLMIVVEFCEQVINCIETDEDVQNALSVFINNVAGTSGTGPAGTPVSNEKLNRDLVAGTNPECNQDILFAQCRAVVQFTNAAIVDVFEKVESVTNVVEFVGAFWNSIPVLGAADDLVGANGIKELFNYYQEAIAEGYDAQYTTTPGGMEDELSYFLWCACQTDCQITIQRIWLFYQERLAPYIIISDFSELIDVLEFMFGVDQDSGFIVELTHTIAWSLLKAGNILFGNRFDNVLPLILKLKADEPSNDWEALAEIFGDCPNCAVEFTVTEGTIIP